MRPAPSLRREEASGAESNSDRLMRCGLSHKQRHTHGRRGKPPSPAPWVLTGPQPRPQPPPDPGLPPTGRGPRPPPELALAARSVAFQSCLDLQPQPPGPSWPLVCPPFLLEPWVCARPAPQGSSWSSGLAGPPGYRWVPRPATVTPPGRVLWPPQLLCCPLCPVPVAPREGSARAPGGPRVPSHP